MLAAYAAPLAPQPSAIARGAQLRRAGPHAVAAVLQTWCAILAAVPKSRLILKNKPFACPETRGLWLRRFTARGISRWRVELLPLTPGTAEHMAQYSLMDISLDPWPYAGAHAAATVALQNVHAVA
jgi:protein O-GlcNAc transferase